MTQPLVYVASAFAGDVEKNTKNAKRYCIHVINEGGIPIAPHLLFPQFLDDNVPAQRKLGLDLGLELLDRSDEIWVFGDISAGMRAEINRAEELKLPIRWFDKDCRETTELMMLRKKADYVLPLAVEIIKEARNTLIEIETTHCIRNGRWDSLSDEIAEFLREVHRIEK